MSTTTSTPVAVDTVTPPIHTPVAPRTFDLSRSARVPFSRLVGVEWRKMVDTRAGLWLTISVALVSAAVMAGLLVWAITDQGNQITANGFLTGMSIPVGILLPVLALMSITSEWSQRTALVTYAHEPHRLRSVGAKLTAVVLLAVVALVVAAALGVLGNVLYGAFSGHAVVWDVTISSLLGAFLIQLLTLLMAYGFGLALLNTPSALSLFFVFSLALPLMVYTPLMALTSWGGDLFPWIDLGTATEPLSTSTMQAADWAHTAVASLIFVAAPLAIGVRRVLGTEVK